MLTKLTNVDYTHRNLCILDRTIIQAVFQLLKTAEIDLSLHASSQCESDKIQLYLKIYIFN